jgi:hypothetical protein
LKTGKLAKEFVEHRRPWVPLGAPDPARYLDNLSVFKFLAFQGNWRREGTWDLTVSVFEAA